MKTIALVIVALCALSTAFAAPQERRTPTATEIYWMQQTINYAKRDSPCPFAAFAAIIVNATTNTAVAWGGGDENDPSGHGEIQAIRYLVENSNGSAGAFNADFWQQLDIYTTGEPCVMCAGAIRWARFRKVVYATSIPALVTMGWPQIPIRARYVHQKSYTNHNADGHFSDYRTEIVAGVLRNETDPLFAWQFKSNAPCPVGCSRQGGICLPTN